jgi:uncharacterized membrane protein YhaH (DUF805 family)
MKLGLFRKGWPILVSLLLVIAAVLYLSYNLSDKPTQNYFYYFNHITYLLAFFLIPIAILLSLVVLWRRRHQRVRSNWNHILGLTLLVLAHSIACGSACLILPITVLHNYKPLDYKYIGEHFYRLDYESWPEVGGGISAAFILIECEPMGWFCHKLHVGELYDSVTLTNHVSKTISGKLVIDTQEKNLEVEIDGKLLYQYDLHTPQ